MVIFINKVSSEIAADYLIQIIDECKKDGWTDIRIEYELDYGGCYYEGDTPSISGSLYGNKK